MSLSSGQLGEREVVRGKKWCWWRGSVWFFGRRVSVVLGQLCVVCKCLAGGWSR